VGLDHDIISINGSEIPNRFDMLSTVE